MASHSWEEITTRSALAMQVWGGPTFGDRGLDATMLTWPMAKLLAFWDYIFSRENKVQTFISGFHSLSENVWFEGILPKRSCFFVWLFGLVTYLDVTGSASTRLGSLGCNPNIPHLEVGEITHGLTIDPNFLGHPSSPKYLCIGT